jgi:DNA-binding response OmpR family regulator
MESPELTHTEQKLLQYLVANSGRTLSRTEILASVWCIHSARVLTRTVDMHIAKLRAKLPDAERLVTIHREGYMMVKV